jgi:membrane protein
MDRLQHFGAFLRLFARTYYDDRCLRSAAALCFTTLLSLVPLAAVTLSVFVAVPVFETFATEVQRFIFENFVPASGTILQQQLTELTTKAAKMTGLGIAFLTLSALLLMDTIEGAINDIWHISAQRKALPRFMVYWAMLTLGPLLIGASLAGTSYLASLPLLSDAALLLEIKTRLLGLLPFLATTLACTLLYAVVPNTHVPLRNALSGAVVAAILFELAKKGFAFYITTFSQYETIYGALAAIPVFLIWLYISWAVVLLGAELSYCLTHFSYLKAARQRSTRGQYLLHDFRSLGLIWQAQRTGHPPSAAMLLEHEQLLDEATLDEALRRLEAAQLIHQTEEDAWALSKDMSTLTLADLYRAQQLALPEIDPQWLKDDPWYQALHHVVTRTNRLALAAQETPLQPLYQT